MRSHVHYAGGRFGGRPQAEGRFPGVNRKDETTGSPETHHSDHSSCAPRQGIYGWNPDSIQRLNTSTFSSGQAPSQGIVPLPSRSRISAAWAWTSARDHRSKANVSLDSRYRPVEGGQPLRVVQRHALGSLKEHEVPERLLTLCAILWPQGWVPSSSAEVTVCCR
jgi:hypothetical protein